LFAAIFIGEELRHTTNGVSMANEFEVWKGKDLSALFRDIYNNQRDTKSQITILIDSLRPLIKNAGDAAVIVPLIKDYLDVSVKNDSNVVRLAAIVERLYAAEKLGGGEDGNGLGLTDAERRQLEASAEEELKKLRGGGTDFQKQIETTKQEVARLTAPESETEDEVETE
jgi:hypothetical protein